MSSKSFRAQLPALRPDEFERLRRWGAENCAASALSREGPHVMWLVMRERARSREDHARSVRGTFKKLSIDASGLRKGHWLTLTCSDLVQAEASALNRNCASQHASVANTTAHMPPAPSLPTLVAADRDDDVRIIPLSSRDRQTRSQTLAVTKAD